jgi:phosphocarrier protein
MEEQVMETFTISNKLGLHARAASHFVQVASRFACEIFVSKNDQEVNGKSIMGILILAAPKGAEISVKATGPDAAQAVVALGELINNRFGED